MDRRSSWRRRGPTTAMSQRPRRSSRSSAATTQLTPALAGRARQRVGRPGRCRGSAPSGCSLVLPRWPWPGPAPRGRRRPRHRTPRRRGSSPGATRPTVTIRRHAPARRPGGASPSTRSPWLTSVLPTIPTLLVVQSAAWPSAWCRCGASPGGCADLRVGRRAGPAPRLRAVPGDPRTSNLGRLPPDGAGAARAAGPALFGADRALVAASRCAAWSSCWLPGRPRPGRSPASAWLLRRARRRRGRAIPRVCRPGLDARRRARRPARASATAASSPRRVRRPTARRRSTRSGACSTHPFQRRSATCSTEENFDDPRDAVRAVALPAVAGARATCCRSSRWSASTWSPTSPSERLARPEHTVAITAFIFVATAFGLSRSAAAASSG